MTSYYRGGGRPYSYDPGKEAAIRHIEAFRELERKLGPIVPDVKEAFLNLGNSDFDQLLAKYGNLHGHRAQDYAKQTYPKWISGEVKMSGMVAERLLKLLPPYLKFEHRYAMVEKLCEYHAKKEHRSVKIDLKKPEAGIDELNQCIQDVLEVSAVNEKYLPEHVLKAINWLNDDDVVISRHMLAKIDRKRNDNSVMLAKKEVNNIVQQLNKINAETHFYQKIDLIGGTIVINAKKNSLIGCTPILVLIALFIIYLIIK
jgi:hypothetical protein